MPKSARVTIVNVGYRSTNYWVVSAAKSRLLVDLGYGKSSITGLKVFGSPIMPFA